jgi:hypothetical protein
MTAGMGDILCDEPTHSHARYKANYEELEPFMVKGKKQPVSAASLAQQGCLTSRL